jgi:hypothetical protein
MSTFSCIIAYDFWKMHACFQKWTTVDFFVSRLHYLELFARFNLRNDDYALWQWFLGKCVDDFYEGIFQRRFWLNIYFLVLPTESWRCWLLSSFWELTLWFIKGFNVLLLGVDVMIWKDIFKYWFLVPKMVLSFLWEVDDPSLGKLTWIYLCWHVWLAALST